MKLLIKLIFILYLFNGLTYSIKVSTPPPPPFSESFNESDYQGDKCFKDLDGYTSEFQANSFKANYPVGENQIMPISYAEIGKLSVSMKDQMMFVHFKIYIDNVIEGRLWGYQSNNTQYIMMNINGTDTCVSQTLQYPLPSKYQVKRIGNVHLGHTKCHVYQVQSAVNYTNQELLVDSKNCAFMSSSVQNPPDSTPGYALINFYNFKRSYDHSTFQLPLECYSATSISTSTSKYQLQMNPKFFKHFNNNNQQ